jgi:DNA-binding NarL/FixJ family response regulator
MGGTRATSEIRQSCPGTRVLILTMHSELEYARAAIAAGASGYLVKSAADLELIEAIRTVDRGQPYVDASLGTNVLAELTHERRRPDAPTGDRPALSAREAEVLSLLARGLTNQETADRLFVSVKTVETHRARLSQKLGLKKRADLVRYALETGLLGQGGGSGS